MPRRIRKNLSSFTALAERPRQLAQFHNEGPENDEKTLFSRRLDLSRTAYRCYTDSWRLETNTRLPQEVIPMWPCPWIHKRKVLLLILLSFAAMC